MQELSKKIIESYQVRKTRNQKTKFIEYLKTELRDYKVRVEEGGPFKSRNIIIGDLVNSKIVLSAHYDTAPMLPFPNFTTPKNIFIYLLFNIFLIACLLIIDVIVAFFVLLLTKDMNITKIVSYFVLFFLFAWLFIGKANKHTMNDNTSGVITLIEALHDEQIRNQVCLVFFDHEETGLFGSAFFARKHKKELKDKLLFNFDCVGDGDTIMLVLNKKARIKKSEITATFLAEDDKQFFITSASTTIYPSDQLNFKKSVGVAALKKNCLFGYYINRIHTNKDVILEERNIDMILKGIKRYLK